MDKTELAEKLNELGYDFEFVGNTVVIYTDDDRTWVLKSIFVALAGSRYNERSHKSSKGEVKLGAWTIIAKKPPKANEVGQDMTEAAQCYYAAACWYENDYSDDSLRRAAQYVSAAVPVEDVIAHLPESWIDSCIKTAEALYANFGSKRLYFHHDSSFVGTIQGNFNAINRELRQFSNINKWSPSDIYLVSDEGLRQPFQFEDFDTLNHFLLESIKSKDIIGVSLKLSQAPSVFKMNMNNNRQSYKYENATIGKKDFFESKDVYILYEDGEIQFRGFPTWQGEIKGRQANHGKISGGPIKSIVDKFSSLKMDTQITVENRIRSKDESFFKDFYEFYSSIVGKGIKYPEFFKITSAKDMNWLSSKYLGTKLVYIMQTSPKRQIILSQIINYATSQTNLSAPYAKVS